MNRHFKYLLPMVMSVVVTIPVVAQDTTDNPFQRLLISPEVLIQHQSQLGLTSAQVDKIRSQVEATAPKAQRLQNDMEKAMGGLAELLSADQVDTDAALKQLDAVLAAEKALKSMHLKLLIAMRNQLTDEQRQMAMKLQHAPGGNANAAGREQRIRANLTKIQKAIQAKAAAGEQPMEAVAMLEKFSEMMQQGRVAQAENVLQRVAAMLDIKLQAVAAGGGQPATMPAQIAQKIEKIQQRAQQLQREGGDVSKIQQIMNRVGKLMQEGRPQQADELLDKALKEIETQPKTPSLPLQEQPTITPQDAAQQAKAMRVEEVAWRKIAWKTCLLEGLQASRKENKPVMLWIFIDRPIDDERC